MPQPIKVKMIVLDENLQPAGECKEFGSMGEAGKAIGQSRSNISLILNPDNTRKTTTDNRTGNTVTFVRADATEEEEKEWLFEVENKEEQPVKVKMIVLDENLQPTGECKEFESMGEAGEYINRSSSNISLILNPDNTRKTTTDNRTGNTVTFVRADATEEEKKEWLFEVENKEEQPVKVKMIVLDENLQPTGECKEFESDTEAGIAISQSKSNISDILDSERYQKTTTDTRTGSTVTFVRADATEEEEKEWLFEVENKENQPRKISVVYVESSKIEYFDSKEKASKSTGINTSTITNDIEKKFINPRKRYHKDTGEEIEFYEA